MQKAHMNNYIALVGSAYTTFEAMFLEPDDIAQTEEEVEFLVNKMRMVGANIKHICNDFVQEMFIEPFDNIEDAHSYQLLLPHNPDDEADQKQGIREKEHCNCQLIHSCSQQLKEVEASSSSASARSIEDSHDSTHDVFNLGLSQMKSSESCIIVDNTELSSESQEPGKLGPYEKISGKDNEKDGGRDQSPGSGQKDEGVESWSDSDWETVQLFEAEENMLPLI